MTDSTRTNETSPEISDPELEQLLGDAFDAPPVPRSLLKRLDAGIESEWGTSPRLADSPSSKLGRGVVRGGRWLRSLPIAAAVAALLMAVVVFWNDSSAFAWSQMVDALSERGVVELESENVQRWLAMSDGLVGDQSSESSRLLDIHLNVLLERDLGAGQIEKRTLRPNRFPTNRDQLFLAFLVGSLNEQNNNNSTSSLTGARLIGESSKAVKRNGAEQIQLDANFLCDNEQSISVRAFVDPDTHLPTSVNITGASLESRQIALSYPAVNSADQRATGFPAGLPVVDVSSEVIQTASVDLPGSGQPSSVAPIPKTSATDLHSTVAAHITEAPTLADTSEWAPVSVTKRSSKQVIAEIDGVMAKLWSENKVRPAEPADNEEMLRRIYLDLAGRTPTVAEVRSYLSNKSSGRYETLVDRLLDSPDHASHLATTYRTFLIPEGVDLDAFGGVETFDEWLMQRFSSNDSYDKVVRSLLLAEGRLSRSGPLLFYSAVKLDPDQLAARTSRVFLGMRLECAQCHDHPFEPWTQEDFWSYAAFFARISRPQGELETVSSVMRVRDTERGEVMLPETETIVPPRFLNAAEAIEDDNAGLRRQRLAQWLTSDKNPYFPRAAANRVWGTMFGRGIVDPIDDFGNENPPVSPELLEVLASHFISTKFDLRELYRVVAMSRAYRLSSGADRVDEERIDLFAQMNVKTLTAEQVYDCITVATMPSDSGGNGFNVDRFSNSSREAFLQQFRTPVGRSTEYQGGIPQSLTLMNGALINGSTGLATSGLLKSLDAPFFTNKQRVEVLYFATLSRRPTESERKLLDEYIAADLEGPQLKENLADILWALLNSAEFTMNH